MNYSVMHLYLDILKYNYTALTADQCQHRGTTYYSLVYKDNKYDMRTRYLWPQGAEQ